MSDKTTEEAAEEYVRGFKEITMTMKPQIERLSTAIAQLREENERLRAFLSPENLYKLLEFNELYCTDYDGEVNYAETKESAKFISKEALTPKPPKKKRIMKKAYAKINYLNCNLDYDYTICELSDIPDHIGLFKTDNEDLDESGFNDWKNKGYLPEVKMELIMLTGEEYLKWFEDNVESKA